MFVMQMIVIVFVFGASKPECLSFDLSAALKYELVWSNKSDLILKMLDSAHSYDFKDLS